MKTKLLLVLILVETLFIGYLLYRLKPDNKPLTKPAVSKPLLKYTYQNLRHYQPVTSDITIGREVRSGDGFISYMFFFRSSGKKVSGLLNTPDKQGTYPVMFMIRGFVDPSQYYSGEGTQHGAEYFAQHGFVTVAPDFLGYGESDKASQNPFEDRFQTYTTVMDLLASLKNLDRGFEQKGISEIKTDSQHIGIWAHSNGGQIALSVAEMTGFAYPMILWAPVSKPFPYSILYYTDEFDDKGKALRKALATFESLYNAENYSLTNYLSWIQAPVQLNQGDADEEVPIQWSNELYSQLKKLGKDISYNTYPGENHNFQNGSWTKAMENGLAFIRSKLGK